MDLPAEPWFSPIAEFYREVERFFSSEWRRYTDIVAAKHGWPTGPSPELWKSAGDELIYTKELADHREALCCIQAWIRAVNHYRESFKTRFPSLDLKCTAWLAGFPVNNAEIVLRSSLGNMRADTDDDDAVFSNLRLLQKHYTDPADNSLKRDYIGPSIDIGFRLSELATARKLVVSVDLALMLVSALRVQPKDFGYPPVKFYYDGRSILKGVFGGTPYPIFWLDMQPEDELNVAEDKLSRVEAIDSDRVKEFCEVFISKHGKYVIVPFIKDNPDPFFAEVPPYHRERMDRLRTFWERETQKREDEISAITASEESDKSADETGLESNLEAFVQAVVPAKGSSTNTESG